AALTKAGPVNPSGPPTYSVLAGTDVVAPQATNAPSGTLCAGANISPGTSSAFGSYATGSYNYQKVALSNNPSKVYEVECWMDPGNNSQANQTTLSGYYNLESCIDACSRYVDPTLGWTCTVAYYAPNAGHVCKVENFASQGLNSIYGNKSPNSLVGSGVQAAR